MRRGSLVFGVFVLWDNIAGAVSVSLPKVEPFGFAGLEQGDRLLLYTDGIVEAANAAGDFFGRDALCELLRKTTGLSPSEAADLILASVQQWSAVQDDDLTVLVCDYVGDGQ